MITVYSVGKRKTLIGQYQGNIKDIKRQKLSEVVRVFDLATKDCSEEELSMGKLMVEGVELSSTVRKYLQTKGINV